MRIQGIGEEQEEAESEIVGNQSNNVQSKRRRVRISRSVAERAMDSIFRSRITSSWLFYFWLCRLSIFIASEVTRHYD